MFLTTVVCDMIHTSTAEVDELCGLICKYTITFEVLICNMDEVFMWLTRSVVVPPRYGMQKPSGSGP
eukprot:6347823-Amphidinium_carterae.1